MSSATSSPTAIQEEAIPELLAGHDVIGQAQTGTGKTATFGLPMLQYLDPENNEVQAIVMTPTRELCIQVHPGAALEWPSISTSRSSPSSAARRSARSSRSCAPVPTSSSPP